MRHLILGRVFNARGIVLLFALMFSVGAVLGVGAWKAEPAEGQVIGGTDAQELGGQVQFYTGPTAIVKAIDLHAIM